MVQMFYQAKFYSNVANKMPYDPDTQFNENNITGYLSELEEYISSLITLMAYKKEDPNAAISSIPLDQLNQKDFNKREMQIDAPVDTERGIYFSGAKTEIGDESAQTQSQQQDDDAIIDSKALYKNFLDLVEGKKLNIIQQSQARRDGMQSHIKDDN